MDERYSSIDLDLIANEVRDQAVALHGELTHSHHYEGEREALSAQLGAFVALADFLRRDAARLRRLEIGNTDVE